MAPPPAPQCALQDGAEFTIARYHNRPAQPLRRRFERGCGATLCLLSLLLGACGSPPVAVDGGAPTPRGSQLPGLSLRPDAAPVLSWVEGTPTGHRLVYAVRENGGWGIPQVVAEGTDWFVNWADVPSVVPLSDRLWAAHWLVKQPGGMYAYDIALALSRDGGTSWDPPRRPYDDTSPTEHGFVSLWPAPQADGTTAVGVAWLDGRHSLLDAAASTTYDPRTSLRSRVFDAQGRPLSASVIDDRVCDCCPTDVALSPDGPIVVYRDRSPEEVRDIAAARFADGAWRALGRVADDDWTITGCPVNGPAVASRRADLAIAWYTEAGGRHRVRVVRGSPDGDWGTALELGKASALGRVSIAWLDGDETAVAWLEDTGNGKAVLRVARVAGTESGAPVDVAELDSARPSGMPRLVRDGDGLLLAWTRWRDGAPQVTTARLPLASLPGLKP
ncbi:MAG: hypothetical protein RIC56_16725 [Pseudomonadales bacterium]